MIQRLCIAWQKSYDKIIRDLGISINGDKAWFGKAENDLHHRILNKKDKIKYEHKEEGKKRRKYVHIVDLETTKKQLVKMNPNNEVNFKLTLNKKELKDISNFKGELNDVLEKWPYLDKGF